jgi:hypothetical protein
LTIFSLSNLGVPSTRLTTSGAQHAAPLQGLIAATLGSKKENVSAQGRKPAKTGFNVDYFAAGRKAGSTKVSHGFRSGIMLSEASKRIISARPGPSTAASLRKALFSGTMNL